MHFGELIFETSILVLMVNDTEHHGKNFMSWEILVKSIIAQIITMLMSMLVLINVALMLIMSVLKNMVLDVEHHQEFGKIVGLIL